GRSWRDRSHPSAIRWSLDLRPCCTDNIGRPMHNRASPSEPKISRGIAFRPAKPLHFNHIARWVFRCAIVDLDPAIQVKLQRLDAGVELLAESHAVKLFQNGLMKALANAVIRYVIFGACCVRR